MRHRLIRQSHARPIAALTPPSLRLWCDLRQYAIAYIEPVTNVVRTSKQLAATLRRYRRQKRFTQLALGHLMHARQATVSKLESGERGTQIGILIDALTALDLELVIRPRTQATADDVEDLF